MITISCLLPYNHHGGSMKKSKAFVNETDLYISIFKRLCNIHTQLMSGDYVKIVGIANTQGWVIVENEQKIKKEVFMGALKLTEDQLCKVERCINEIKSVTEVSAV